MRKNKKIDQTITVKSVMELVLAKQKKTKFITTRRKGRGLSELRKFVLLLNYDTILILAAVPQ